MHVSGISHQSGNHNASYWEQKIKRTFPALYPIYKGTLLDSPPSEGHYRQLKEAVACVQAKLKGQPLPPAFKVWKALNLDSLTSVIIDNKGREIFHFVGEPRNNLIVRLALRTQSAPALTVSLEPLSEALGVSRAVFVKECDLLHGGLIAGIQYGGKTVYLLGELHGVSFYQQMRHSIGQAVRQQKVIAFYEGIARDESAETKIKQEEQVTQEAHVFGLEHPSIYCLVASLEISRPWQALYSMHWNLQWAPNGPALWKQFAETFPPEQAHLLQTAFIGQPFFHSLPPQLVSQLAFLQEEHSLQLSAMIVKDLPEHHLTRLERQILMACFTRPNNALVKYAYLLLQDRRNFWFARNLREKLADLPDRTPIVAVMGVLHLNGVRDHLRNLNSHDLKTQQQICKQFINSSLFAGQLHHRVKRTRCAELTTIFFNPAGLRSRLAETRVNYWRCYPYIRSLIGAAVRTTEGLQSCIYRVQRLCQRSFAPKN